MLIDVPEAQAILFRHVRPGATVRMPLREALFRTLVEPVSCDVDYPPFDRSVMDGYAVRAADVASAPVQLKLVGRIAAGAMPQKKLSSGQTMQINTGAPLPAGADAVVRLEDTQLSSDATHLMFQQSVPPGHFITRRGTYVSAGQTVLAAGTRLTPLEIAVAATAGAASVTVYRQPRVAVLATGDELIDIDQTPRGAEIRNSNQYLLEALIRGTHAEPLVLGVARDHPETTRTKIAEGLEADVLCITGGVSVGEFDFVPKALAALGACVHIHKMMIKPGRPTLFATMPSGTLVFALPGNPVSAFVGFELFVRPSLAALEGRCGIVPRPVGAKLRGALSASADRRSYWPARVQADPDGDLHAEALAWHGSGDPFGLATANAMIMRPPNSPAATTGERVSVLLLDRV